MSRIASISNREASDEQYELLEAIEKDMGMVPNILRVLANSPVALRAFLGLHGIADNGELNYQTRERIALAVAQQNASEYCLSAHTVIGGKVGLSDDEMRINRTGSSLDQKAAVAIQLARSLVRNMGNVTTDELIEARKAGYSEAEIVEIVVHVGMNILTNLIGNSAHVGIDFLPKQAVKS